MISKDFSRKRGTLEQIVIMCQYFYGCIEVIILCNRYHIMGMIAVDSRSSPGMLKDN